MDFDGRQSGFYMANPDGSMDGWVAEQQEEGRASYHCRQDEGLLTTGLAACPKTRNLMESTTTSVQVSAAAL